MSNTVAYEMITDRLSHYSAAKLEKYDPVMINSAGKYAKADGTAPFVGIVEYGVDAADEMVTVVKGIYPGKAGADIVAGGTPLTITAGTFVTAEATELVVGVALAAATTGNLVSVHMVEPYILA